MPEDTYIHGFVIFAFLALLLWAAIEDFRAFKIPNVISLALLVLFPVYVLSAPAAVPWVLSLIAAVGVLVIGFLLFATGALGAGDAKLLAATTLWIGPADFLLFVIVLAASTVAVLFVVALRTAWQAEAGQAASGGARAIGAVAALRFVPLRKLTIPYGVAIAAGGVAVALSRLSALPF